jgi:hypothetical protein
MRISERGQITIPKHIRERFGLWWTPLSRPLPSQFKTESHAGSYSKCNVPRSQDSRPAGAGLVRGVGPISTVTASSAAGSVIGPLRRMLSPGRASLPVCWEAY